MPPAVPSEPFAYMLDAMGTSGALLTRARTDAHLTRNALAGRAGVPASTVGRIEAGQVEPTVAMLERLLHAAGAQLQLGTVPLEPAPTLAALAGAQTSGPLGPLPDFTRLRALVDWTALHPDRVAQVIADRPRTARGSLIGAILAALAEVLADEHHLPRPAWTARVPALGREWSAPLPPRRVAAARKQTPAPFAARRVVLAREELWRPHD